MKEKWAMKKKQNAVNTITHMLKQQGTGGSHCKEEDVAIRTRQGRIGQKLGRLTV